ncbi:uncharacterized protein LOC135824572 [Sycon ciliatum]|uniref:uncharacterized protein LOC135824572 n=1 Tax=Sycon ciliatum TaxID=27933 RepID=UPI0031F70889
MASNHRPTHGATAAAATRYSPGRQQSARNVYGTGPASGEDAGELDVMLLLGDTGFLRRYPNLWREADVLYKPKLAENLRVKDMINYFQEWLSPRDLQSLAEGTDFGKSETLIEILERGHNATFVPFFEKLWEHQRTLPVVQEIKSQLIELYRKRVEEQNPISHGGEQWYYFAIDVNKVLEDPVFLERYDDLWNEVARKHMRELREFINAADLLNLVSSQHLLEERTIRELETKQGDDLNRDLLLQLQEGGNETFVPFFQHLWSESKDVDVVQRMHRQILHLLHTSGNKKPPDSQGTSVSTFELWKVVRKEEEDLNKLMASQWKRLLQKMRFDLEISIEERNEIESQHTDFLRFKALLRVYERKGEESFAVFLDALNELDLMSKANKLRQLANVEFSLPDGYLEKLDTRMKRKRKARQDPGKEMYRKIIYPNLHDLSQCMLVRDFLTDLRTKDVVSFSQKTDIEERGKDPVDQAGYLLDLMQHKSETQQKDFLYILYKQPGKVKDIAKDLLQQHFEGVGKSQKTAKRLWYSTALGKEEHAIKLDFTRPGPAIVETPPILVDRDAIRYLRIALEKVGKCTSKLGGQAVDGQQPADDDGTASAMKYTNLKVLVMAGNRECIEGILHGHQIADGKSLAHLVDVEPGSSVLCFVDNVTDTTGEAYLVLNLHEHEPISTACQLLNLTMDASDSVLLAFTDHDWPWDRDAAGMRRSRNGTRIVFKEKFGNLKRHPKQLDPNNPLKLLRFKYAWYGCKGSLAWQTRRLAIAVTQPYQMVQFPSENDARKEEAIRSCFNITNGRQSNTPRTATATATPGTTDMGNVPIIEGPIIQPMDRVDLRRLPRQPMVQFDQLFTNMALGPSLSVLSTVSLDSDDPLPQDASSHGDASSAICRQCFASNPVPVEQRAKFVDVVHNLIEVSPLASELRHRSDPTYVTTVLTDDELSAMTIANMCSGGMMAASIPGDAKVAAIKPGRGRRPEVEQRKHARLLLSTRLLDMRVHNFFCFEGLHLLSQSKEPFQDAAMPLLLPAVALSNVFIVCSDNPVGAVKRLVAVIQQMKEHMKSLWVDPKEKESKLDPQKIDSGLFTGRLLVLSTSRQSNDEDGSQKLCHLDPEDQDTLSEFFGDYDERHYDEVQLEAEQREACVRQFAAERITAHLGELSTPCFKSAGFHDSLCLMLGAAATACTSFTSLKLSQVHHRETIEFFELLLTALRSGEWNGKPCNSGTQELKIDGEVVEPFHRPQKYKWSMDAGLPLDFKVDMDSSDIDKCFDGVEKLLSDAARAMINALRVDVARAVLKSEEDWWSRGPAALHTQTKTALDILCKRRQRAVKAPSHTHRQGLRGTLDLEAETKSCFSFFESIWEPCDQPCSYKPCHLLCLQPRGHRDKHDCLFDHGKQGNHYCGRPCTYCRKKKTREGEPGQCMAGAGHKSRRCQCWQEGGDVPPQHKCEEPCDYMDAWVHKHGDRTQVESSICYKDALHEESSRDDEHIGDDQAEHKCSAERHTCAQQCQLRPTSRARCEKYCLHDIDKGQGHDLHTCGATDHKCPDVCQAEGVCAIANNSESELNPNICRDEEQRIGVNGYKMFCGSTLDTMTLTHSGNHQCGKEQKDHTCTEICPLCSMVCRLGWDHEGPHDMKHGQIRNSRFARVRNGRTHELVSHDTPPRCDQLCPGKDYMRGHEHILSKDIVSLLAKRSSAFDTSASGHRPFFPRQEQDGDNHKVVNHTFFWKRLNIVDPNAGSADFDRCPMQCPRHPATSAPYCTGSLWHEAFDEKHKPDDKGYTGKAVREEIDGVERKQSRGNEHNVYIGHHFPCSREPDHMCNGLCTLPEKLEKCMRGTERSQCSKPVGHHGVCSCQTAEKHVCGIPCPATLESGLCGEPCVRRVEEHNSEDQHDHELHWCGIDRCCMKCDCGANCSKSGQPIDHLHGGEDKPIPHHCGIRHECRELCEEDGICMLASDPTTVDPEKHKRRSSDGNGYRLVCDIKKPIGEIEHEEKHSCRNTHTCTVQCPGCHRYCTRDINHKGNHRLDEHGPYRNDSCVVRNGVSGNVEVSGERTCGQLCKEAGRGHAHCRLGEKSQRHSAFWESFRFDCPCPEDRDFLDGCPVKCNAKERHGPKANVYCQGKLFHELSDKPELDNATAATSLMYTGLQIYGVDENGRELCGHWFACSTKHKCAEACFRCSRDENQSEKRARDVACRFFRHDHESRCRCRKEHHQCRVECEAPGCKVLCTQDDYYEHADHKCDATGCENRCEIGNCTADCNAPDHVHSTKNKGLHHCNQRHSCAKYCDMDGVCHVTTIHGKAPEDSRALVSGLSNTTGYHLKCVKPLPAGKKMHAGKHECSAESHTCKEQCPLCKRHCELHAGHHKSGSLHQVQHGTIVTAVKLSVGLDDEVHIEGGVTCQDMCEKGGRGHLHIGSAYMNFKKSISSHAKFWHDMKFKDPASPEQQKEYGLCGKPCILPHSSDPPYCAYDVNHLHPTTGTADRSSVFHHCKQQHTCNQPCEALGVCVILSPGGDEQPLNVTATAYPNGFRNSFCKIPIPPRLQKHDKSHDCGVVHHCNKSCSMCGHCCSRPYDHTGTACSVTHGSIKPEVLAKIALLGKDGREVQLPDAAITCDKLCKIAGPSHSHLIYDVDAASSTSISRTKARQVSHRTFWDNLSLLDPYPEGESRLFNACPVVCTLPGHDGIENRQCLGEIHHQLYNPEAEPERGFTAEERHGQLQGHRFECEEHVCGDKCELFQDGQRCEGTCTLLDGHDKSAQPCKCKSAHTCPKQCQDEDCAKQCSMDDSHKVSDSSPLQHHCGKSHKCKVACNEPGPCKVVPEVEKESFISENPNAEKIAGNAFKLFCNIPVPPGKTTHPGVKHSCQQAHGCDKTCPLCGFHCETAGSTTHDQHLVSQHGAVLSSARASLRNGNGSTPSQLPDDTTCHTVCGSLEESRSHSHVPDYDLVAAHYNKGKIKESYRRVGIKCKVTHALFWDVHSFADPSVDPANGFDKCPAPCPRDQEHGEDKVYCTQLLYHQTVPQSGKPELPGFADNGHHFPCDNHLCNDPCGQANQYGPCVEHCMRPLKHSRGHDCEKEHKCDQTCRGTDCSNKCELKMGHDKKQKCNCGIGKCTAKCDHCDADCEAKDHFHHPTGSTVHDCGATHICSESKRTGNKDIKCNTSEGNCTLPFFSKLDSDQKIALVKDGTLPALRLPCKRIIPTGQAEHGGEHAHHDDASQLQHTCNAFCPTCGECCDKVVHADGELHSTTHGTFRSLRPAEIQEHALSPWRVVDTKDESMVPPIAQQTPDSPPSVITCSTVCSSLKREHHHCKVRVDKSATESLDVTFTERVTHSQFWKAIGFVDPYSEDETAEFDHCHARCQHEEHGGDAVFCEGRQLHAGPLVTGANPGLLPQSTTGHMFKCSHPCSGHCVYKEVSRNCGKDCDDRREHHAGPCLCAETAHRCKERCEVNRQSKTTTAGKPLCTGECDVILDRRDGTAHEDHRCDLHDCVALCSAADCKKTCTRAHDHVLHEGHEKHKCGDSHVCSTPCPFCGAQCELPPHDATTLHRAAHGQIRMDGRQKLQTFATAQQTLPILLDFAHSCENVCQNSGWGHLHILACTSEARQADCSGDGYHIESEQLHKKELHFCTHRYFWEQAAGFEQPATSDGFSKCGERCHAGHSTTCTLDVLHKTLPDRQQQKVRDGHRFSHCASKCDGKCESGSHGTVRNRPQTCGLIQDHSGLHLCMDCVGQLCPEKCPQCHEKCIKKVQHAESDGHYVLHGEIKAPNTEFRVCEKSSMNPIDQTGKTCWEMCVVKDDHYHILQECSGYGGADCKATGSNKHIKHSHELSADYIDHDHYWKLQKFALSGPISNGI